MCLMVCEILQHQVKDGYGKRKRWQGGKFFSGRIYDSTVDIGNEK